MELKTWIGGDDLGVFNTDNFKSDEGVKITIDYDDSYLDKIMLMIESDADDGSVNCAGVLQLWLDRPKAIFIANMLKSFIDTCPNC